MNSNYVRLGQKRGFQEPRSGIKAWRLIIRGLDDFTKREELEEYFGKIGKLKEIVLPKSKIKENANAPYGFIQYANKSDADKAVKELNDKPFKGRKLKVEISLDKDTYITKKHEEKETIAKKAKLEAKVEAESTDEDTEVDDESSDNEEEVEAVKPQPVKKQKKEVVRTGPLPEVEDLVESSDSEDETMAEETVESESEEESAEEEESSEGEDEEEEEKKPEPEKPKIRKDKPTKSDTAVEEGRVIFLRNLSYEIDEETLKEEMEKYGEVTLAIPCTFKDSGHPTGSAFVHFKDKESADKVLEALESENGILIDGRKVFGYLAVPREKATEFKKPDKTPTDNRNLYLLRIPLIRPDSAQANDMSEEDTRKRASLLSLTKQKLKNLHMFVSPTRLAIHNVPFTMSDKDLLKLCKEATKNPKAYITECRIMRKKISSNAGSKTKLGASKGFAFVEFEKHEDALACLKKLNNNPDVFKKDRRPIVEFSIENRSALRLREKRALKNQEPSSKSKNKKGKVKKEVVDNTAAVEKTKKTMMKNGAKPLPKKFFAAKGKDRTKKSIKGKKKAAKKSGKKGGAKKA